MLQGEHSAILSTIIKLPFVIKMIFVLAIFEWPFYTGYSVPGPNFIFLSPQCSIFVPCSLAITSNGRVSLWFCGFYVQEHPKGSTGSGSGFKASQKMGPQCNVSSDRLGEAENRTSIFFRNSIWTLLTVKYVMNEQLKYILTFQRSILSRKIHVV